MLFQYEAAAVGIRQLESAVWPHFSSVDKVTAILGFLWGHEINSCSGYVLQLHCAHYLSREVTQVKHILLALDLLMTKRYFSHFFHSGDRETGQNGLVVQRVSVITELKAPDLVRYFSLKPVCSSAAGQSGSLRLINTDSQRKRVKRR